MAKPGDPFRDVYTADWYNRVTSVIDPTYGGPRPQSSNNQYVTVYNHSTTPREIWEAVSLGTPKLDYAVPLTDGAHGEFAFNSRNYASSNHNDRHNLVILQEPLAGEVGASARALMSGVSWLKLSVVPLRPYDNFISISTSNVLSYSNHGRIEVRTYFEYAASTYIALVTIGELTLPITPYRFRLLEDLGTGIAVAEIFGMDGTSIGYHNLYDPEGIFDVLVTNNRGIAIREEDRFYVYNAKCPEDQ